MSAMDIKNLAIAMEALSRIRGAYYQYPAIERLLDKAIVREEEKYEVPVTEPPPKPARPNDLPF